MDDVYIMFNVALPSPRSQRSIPADGSPAVTGQELYSSGEQIPGWTHFSGLAVAKGRAYVVTWDAKVYAFGLAR